MSRFSNQFKIDTRTVGGKNPSYIIAEAGVAHFGKEEKAYRLVDMAVEAGADAVKFQIFNVDALIGKNSDDWKERLGSRQLPYAAFERIQSYCREQGITFFATAHDEPSLDFLCSLNVPAFKIGSGEVGNWSYIARVANLGKPTIFSTGMYRLEQIEQALDILSETNNKNIAVLHCITEYPVSPEKVNLVNIKEIRRRFQVVTGYSDHTVGFHIPLAAVVLGASIIEKHISLDFNVPNAQDWKVSCGPHNFTDFIGQVREIEAALLSKEIGPTEGEKQSLLWAAKSLVAKCDIPEGAILTEKQMSAKRPGTGISPAEIQKLVGRKVKQAIKMDEIISWENLD